jgi:tol-pal system protein YbgF
MRNAACTDGHAALPRLSGRAVSLSAVASTSRVRTAAVDIFERRTTMIRFFTSPRLAAVCLAMATVFPLQASAGLLDDDEARKAILELRAKVDNIQRDLATRIDTKADKSAALNLVNQNEQALAEIAKLRGQIELLSNDVAVLQKKQNELYAALDARILKLEPRQVTIDGQEAAVAPDEQTSYDAAMAMFKGGDYKSAAVQLADFVRRYPLSGYAANAQYWLGNAHYAQRDCVKAIAAQQVVVSTYPDSAKAPDAMLNIGNCYIEQKNKKAANKALRDLIAKYPNSNSAQAARDLLPSVK